MRASFQMFCYRIQINQVISSMQLDTDFTLIFGILAFALGLVGCYQGYKMAKQPCAQCGHS